MKERHKVSVASYVILRKDNQILMTRRVNTGYHDGDYSLPAGHIENGEFPDEAIIREAKEEIGVDLIDLKFVTVLYTKDNYVCFFFETDKWEGEITNCEAEKCDDIQWFDLNNLPTNVVPEVVTALANYGKKEYYSREYNS